MVEPGNQQSDARDSGPPTAPLPSYGQYPYQDPPPGPQGYPTGYSKDDGYSGDQDPWQGDYPAPNAPGYGYAPPMAAPIAAAGHGAAIAWIGAGVVVVGGGAIFALAPQSGQAPPCSEGSQCDYQAKYKEDMQSLTSGRATFPVRITSDVGEDVEFEVTVTTGQPAQGTASPGAPSDPGTSGAPATTAPLATGGNVRLNAYPSDGSVKIESLNSSVLPLVVDGQSATWKFRASASEVGDYKIDVTYEVLKGDTDTVLLAEPDIVIPFESHQTVKNFFKESFAILVWVGGVAAALAAILVPSVRRFLKRVFTAAWRFIKRPFAGNPAPPAPPAPQPAPTPPPGGSTGSGTN